LLLCTLRIDHKPSTTVINAYGVLTTWPGPASCKPGLVAGQHGFNGYVTGTMPLSAGLHSIEVDYYQVR
jgi:hypothetical protein